MSVMIEMEHINRIFPVPGGTFQALKDIDAQIDAGTFTILKGRSGSGKTTLLNIIGALDLPTSGRICMEGKDLTTMSEYEREELRRKQMGYVFQAVSLIPAMNAFQNVEFSMRLSGVKSPGERQERRGMPENGRAWKPYDAYACRNVRWGTAACGYCAGFCTPPQADPCG